MQSNQLEVHPPLRNGAGGGKGLGAVRLTPIRNAHSGKDQEALVFKGPTKAQKRKTEQSPDAKLEPLSVLQQHQHLNSPTYIHKQNKVHLEQEGVYDRLEQREKQVQLRMKRFYEEKRHENEARQAAEQEAAERNKPKVDPQQVLRERFREAKLGQQVAWGPTVPVVEHTVDPQEFNGMTDMLEVIEALRKYPDLGFLYLSIAVPKNSVDYHYYNLMVVDYEECYKPDCCTISLKGVTRMRADDETDFTPLERFEYEYRQFKMLQQIPVFKLFRKWKMFSVWRKNVLSAKIESCKKYLNENLFILNSSLRPAVLNVREMCYRISDMGLCRIEQGYTYTLPDFSEVQFKQLHEVVERLTQFRDLVKEVIRSACRTALLEAGFTPDDYFIDMSEPMREGSAIGSGGGGEDAAPATGSSYLLQDYDIDIYGLAPDKMSYTEQANKRTHCKRLTNFIRLADYLVVNTMHVLAVNSVSTLLNHLTEQLKNTPSLQDIRGWMELVMNPPAVEEDAAKDKKPQEKKPVAPTAPSATGEEEVVEKVHIPLFLTEFVLEFEQIRFAPSLEEYQNGLHEVISRFKQAVLSVQNLVPDPYFDAFTRPIINNKFEEKTCGEGPSLRSIFDEDRYMTKLILSVKDSVNVAFNACSEYSLTYEPIRQFYMHDEMLDVEALKGQQHDVPFFAEALERYHREHQIVSRIKEKQPVSMFLVDGAVMKAQLIPSPLRCLDAICDMLPKWARKNVDSLLHELQDAQYKLEIEPKSTIEYVEALTFLDQIQSRIEPLEAEAEVVKEAYERIDRFKVPTPPEDFAVYQTLFPSINTVKNCIDKVLGERDQRVDQLDKNLEKDIVELNKEVKELKQEAQNPMILDLNAEMEKVNALLHKVEEKMSELQKSAYTFKNYQKQFKLEQTRFDELEEANAELKLKQLLWDSMREWDHIVMEWMAAPLDTLDPENLNLTTQKYAKSVYQLEKGLPPNSVVPKLKEKVETIKEKLPVVTDLRNPTMKPRHWEKVEEAIGVKVVSLGVEEPLTLRKLVEINAFAKGEQIQEISAMASSEASLETLLKKVEDSWKNMEFVTLKYKDFKDVFILGGTDEIQQLWDDSYINVSTIQSSRYVGPIKPRVDEWQRQLDLFNRTLEVWLECQRQWLYLESIFSAPDIQRQLPAEAKMFMTVDKSYKEIMRKVNKMPLAIRAATAPGLLETFQNNNILLEKINKCLEAYLESKRVVFPRFYFLSNDELLEILAQTRNPLAVQPHLRKCFDAIMKLEFDVQRNEKERSDADGKQTPGPGDDDAAAAAPAPNANAVDGVVYTNDILAMISAENERVSLGKGLKARGNVEDWLGKVEEAMFVNLRKLLKAAIADFERRERKDWIVAHASQIVLTVAQMMWCRDISEILAGDMNRLEGLQSFEKECFAKLSELAAIVRGELPKLARAIICALITLDVHARDVVTDMVKAGVDSPQSFDWLKQLRYYWDYELDNCVVRMSNSLYVYGYEYLGASPRLVITPLTDRCYLCLMGALQLDLGGAPAGPAGTGKTETCKDMSKSVAKQCVVFNCSDGLDYKMMGKFFSGLAQSGAWCCFDEFNRIDIEVLSVIAQQLITIRNAKASKLTRFMFEGREIKLNPQCAVYITMNPGYAGRTELPDNLKALFRPISMMVPDYKLIAEVILYSEGFENSKHLAQKMTQMYKLCSEQLSQQDHYDFGMRALKSVLVMAGSLKRQNPDKNEDIVLIRALRDSNLPKFLKNDAVLFQAILQDLFPGVEIPEHDYGSLEREIRSAIRKKQLEEVDSQVKRVIQLYETMVVRHGVMLVGPTGGGKTTVYEVLQDAVITLHSQGLSRQNPFYQPVHTHILNPKAITMGELYGEVNKLTMEWHDGLMGFLVRQAVKDTSEDHHWIICDSPVDALWIENMNSVLDDNKLLCLANSERIKFTPYMHMVFEVQDLAVASPATVSRCGMVYIDPADIGWMPFVKVWMNSFKSKLQEETVTYLMNLFERYVDDGLTFVSKKCTQPIHMVPLAKVQTLCKLFEVMINTSSLNLMQTDLTKLHPLLATTFVFCYLWGVGGNISDSNWDAFDSFIRQQFEDLGEARLPTSQDLWSCYVDLDAKRMDSWERIVPLFRYNKEVPFFDMLVPTVDTVRFGYLLSKLVQAGRSVLFTGGTGVGKSVIARSTLNSLSQKSNYVPLFVNFSAQTSSGRTQEIIESKLEKRRKTILGPPQGKQMVILVDDLNMPKLDRYGAQPPVELLRQIQDFRGFYDRDKLVWKELQDVIICAACGPPGGGRNPVTPRFVRHFSMFTLPAPSEHSLKHMFTAILQGFLNDFPPQVRQCAENIIGAAVEIYNRMATDFLPTPTKSHYVFNLRDLSKCVQGMLQCDAGTMREPKQIYRLFYHELQRVFFDRLNTNDDRTSFFRILSEMAQKYTGEQIDPDTFMNQPIVFGDFMKIGADKADRLYDDLSADLKKVANILRDYLDDYNMTNGKDVKLVFFTDAIQHVSRIARMIRQDRGNALLVGVGGTGKQSLTRLAAHINSYSCFQIELTRNYGYDSFHDDLKKLYTLCGVQNKPAVFLFTDTQIVVEEFLEDINGILNSGEVPNLFAPDEYEQLIIGCRPAAKDLGIAEGNRDAIYEFCINRVRNNLHVVLCMSPVGSAFRSRCRQFPSLVNCCTIDWFTEWPREALLGVANFLFQPVELGDDRMKQSIAEMCVEIHMSVTAMAERMYAELKRKFYTTPTSYLELINLYLSMLADKKRQLIASRDRVKNGLTKILETNSLVGNMEAELTALEPELRKKSADTEALMERLAVDQEKADAVRRVVKEDEAVAKVKAEETKAIADDAQRDLNEALPALDAAIKSLDALDKNDIAEIRVFTKPPELVQTVMEAVCLLLGGKTDWASAKQLLGDASFLRRLYEYDKDNMSEKLLQKLKVYMDNPQFTPDKVEKVSKACKSMCMWVRAMDLYARVFKTVKPKKERLAAAQSELDAVMTTLKEKQNKLKEVEDKIATLQKTYDDSMEQKRKLEHNIQLTQQRLKRAGKLTTSLADERVRWEQTVLDFNAQIEAVIGNVFVAAACVAYEGAFTNIYRQELLANWIVKCQALGIPVQDSFSLANVLADAFEIRQWNTDGLPRDQVSIENAILVTRGRRWPLMIDPQEQANRWIKNKEGRNGLKVIKLSTPNFMRTLENCIRLGIPALLEELGESLDPSLEPILLKQTFVSGGRMLIRLGDQDVDYDKNFRFYMTTKMANPHYLPEICIKVTIINFTVTKSGLEDQLLSEVTRLERPELELQRNELIVKINTDKNQLKSIEDRILKLLNESEGNILDNVDLINTLNESKVTSAAIVSRLKEAEKTEKQITDARNKYLPVSKRGATMYFVVADLAEVDPMYQFSLKYFKTLFNTTIENSEKSSDLQTRIGIILTQTTISVYNNVARGLFEKDKLVFSFMLCAEIMKLEGSINNSEWMTMLRGVGGFERDRPPKPLVPWLTQQQWNICVDLQDALPCFKNFAREFVSTPISIKFGDQPEVTLNPAEYEGYVSSSELPTFPFDEAAEKLDVKGHWNERLNSFQKLILVRCFIEDQVVSAVTQFVKENLGQLFIESPRTDLPALYEDINNQTPLVFILSQGSDPMNAFLRFARERGKIERIQTISLGQGQGPVAEKLMENARKFGDWVFLQNCHLASSWMSVLEELVKNLSEPVPQTGPDPPTPLHEDFRLFMSSMPSKTFPVLVLQSSVKVTNEPPKGIRSNLKRAFQEMTPSYFETHNLGETWRKVVFGICMFHAVVLERRKFGALGFNIRYEFNDSDRECALLNLQMFIQESVPWDALIYITGEITYGGRVTDSWDQRCLRSILARFFHPDTLAPGYKYSPSGVYFASDYETLGEVREFVDELPILDEPEIFGMHQNANIVYQVQETNALISTILEVQPRLASGSSGKSNDEVVFELCDSILEKLVEKIDVDLAKQELFDTDSKGRVASLTTVLVQEIERYNKLLNVIRNSLEQLQKAIRGFVVMSEQLEQVYVALLNNQVPRMWADAAYPSLKALGGWTKNLVLRLNFITDWMKRGQPKSIWISGFFFPQGFLTGVLQTHARKYNLPIDRLSFEFRVLDVYRDQAEVDKRLPELKFGEELEMDKLFEPAADGVIVHGCFMDGFRWNDEAAMIADSKPAEMIAELPIMHMLPKFDYDTDPSAYVAPFYKTAVRAGVLSTTGHSTNFIVGVALPTNMSSHYWILKGAALVSERRDT